MAQQNKIGNSDKSQTAVEWLQEWLQPHFTEEQKKQFRHIWKHAKQLEKEQIMKAVYDSMGTNFDPNMGRAEQYYNETYGE